MLQIRAFGSGMERISSSRGKSGHRISQPSGVFASFYHPIKIVLCDVSVSASIKVYGILERRNAGSVGAVARPAFVVLIGPQAC
jgi:hypothetical protein